jgi:hypothetical protein
MTGLRSTDTREEQTCEVVAASAYEGGPSAVGEAQGSEAVPLRLEGPAIPGRPAAPGSRAWARAIAEKKPWSWAPVPIFERGPSSGSTPPKTHPPGGDNRVCRLS